MKVAAAYPHFGEERSLVGRYGSGRVCGADLSATIGWSGQPAGSKSFAWIVGDPDAPIATWDQWLLWDLPSAMQSLSQRWKPGNPGRTGTNPAPLRAFFRFYAELNDHLGPALRHQTVEKEFFVPASVKDMVEGFGIPHTEIELIVVNGEGADFSRVIRDGDRVAVYPVFESIDITPQLRLRPLALRDPKFVLDVHLGRLAAYLRMLGFDAQYSSAAGDPELVRLSIGQRRILLTRDRGLLRHSAVTHGYWLRETDSRRQVVEVLRRFDLVGLLRPFTRCIACNELLCSASMAEIRDRIPPRVAERYREFRECARCHRVYWPGSHYQRMAQWVEKLTTEAMSP